MDPNTYPECQGNVLGHNEGKLGQLSASSKEPLDEKLISQQGCVVIDFTSVPSQPIHGVDSWITKAAAIELKWLLDSLTLSQEYLFKEHGLNLKEKRQLIKYFNELIEGLENEQ